MKFYILFGFIFAVLIVTGLAQQTTISDVNAFNKP
jgi:hypothetical protein